MVTVTVTLPETETETERETLSLCWRRIRCRLWSRRRLASLDAQRSTLDGGVDVDVDVIRFLESNSYSHPAENSHIAFTV